MSGKIKYISARVYVQKDGSYKGVASVEREGETSESPNVVTAEFGEVKDDPLEALADALDRVKAGES